MAVFVRVFGKPTVLIKPQVRRGDIVRDRIDFKQHALGACRCGAVCSSNAGKLSAYSAAKGAKYGWSEVRMRRVSMADEKQSKRSASILPNPACGNVAFLRSVFTRRKNGFLPHDGTVRTSKKRKPPENNSNVLPEKNNESPAQSKDFFCLDTMKSYQGLAKRPGCLFLQEFL